MIVLPEHDVQSQAYKKARRLYYKTVKNRDIQNDSEWTSFRAAEKKYKARFPPPDLSNVLDLAVLDQARTTEVSQGGWTGRPDAINCTEIKLKDQPGNAYIFESHPGLVLLPGYLSQACQRDLVRWALRDHARKPNETNLDTHYGLPEQGLWNSHIESILSDGPVPDIQPRASVETSSQTFMQPPSGPRQLVFNTAANATNVHLLTLSASAQPAPAPSTTVPPSSPSDLTRKLRWANIGWFYHWGTKQYDFTKGKIDVDPQIREICQGVIQAINWDDVFDDNDESQWEGNGEDWRAWDETYEPDAGIVNFYQTKDTLMAHVDRSEVCTTTPLVSISLGCAAIFLIGGLTRDTEPMPILLRSGDIVIMSGPACRRAYHGIPRILENTLPTHLENDPNGSKNVTDEWRPFEDYLHTTRININVRQVFPKGFLPVWQQDANS